MGKRVVGSCLPFFDEFIPKVIEFLEQRGYEWNPADTNFISNLYMETWMDKIIVHEGDEKRYACAEHRIRQPILCHPTSPRYQISLSDLFHGWKSPEILKCILVEYSLKPEILKMACNFGREIERFSLWGEIDGYLIMNVFDPNIDTCSHTYGYVNPEMQKLLSI